MFPTKRLVAIMGMSALMLSPLATSIPFPDSGAAFAEKGGGNGGERSGGNSGERGGDKGKGGGKSTERSQKSNGNSPSAARQANAVKPANAPSTLGKMNGAMNASINAVLAHIRNGQTTNGPVGLFAGLAAADSTLAAVQATQLDLLDVATSYDALDAAIAGSGIEGVTDVESYLAQYDATNPATQNADIDLALAAVGGDAATGTAPTAVAPTDGEVADAIAALETATGAVADAEAALLEAANKDQMDGDSLLQALRDRLVDHQAEIASAVSGI